MLIFFAKSLLCLSAYVAVVAGVENAEISAGLTFLNADRELDLSAQIVRERISLEIQNNDKSAQKYFLVAIREDDSDHLAWLEASTGRDDNKKIFKSAKVAVKGRKETFYKFDFATPLNSGQTAKVVVDAAYTHLLSPYPSHITQKDQQQVVYNGNVYIISPYTIKKQTTAVKLSPPGTTESYTKVQPVKTDGDTITYGPYENAEPFKQQELRIHYENNMPFLTVTKLTRLIEVSHWGNIAVEETLDMVHSGAALKGSFSRFDFQRDHRDKQPCVKSFKTFLPASAKDVYYRDEIGNISTSHLRQLDEAVEVDIRPRFPLFGGWKTNYYIGYNLPSYEYLFSSGNRFALQMRFIDHIFDNFVIDDVTVKIVLPENVKDIKFVPPYPVTRSPDELHYTYLDVTGRPVVILNKKNLIEQHIQNFELHYTFDRINMFREPFIMIVAFFLLFFVVIIAVRLDFTIAKDAASESRLKVAGLIEQISDIQNSRSSAYEAYMDAVEKFRNNKDATSFAAARKKVENDLKNSTQQISDISSSVKNENPEATDKINELQRLDRTIKEHLTGFGQQAERLVSGKLSKQQFADAEKACRSKVDELKHKLDSIVYTL